MIRCNNCYKEFIDEEDLQILTDTSKKEVEYYKGCPICKTDSFLMDIELKERR